MRRAFVRWKVRRALPVVFVLACGIGVASPAVAQFPGQGESIQRSTTIVDRARKERGEPSEEDTRIRILVPGKDERVQLDRWTYAPSVSGVDPLTQIVRIYDERSYGTGFLLPDCRVMTNLHVIAGKQTRAARQAGESLVGKEVSYESLPLPWLDDARVRGRVVILGHGKGEVISDDGRELEPDADWAIGYDLGCASQRFSLGVLHVGEPLKDVSALAAWNTFTAGFTGVKMRGLSPWEYPLYIDTACRVLWPAGAAFPSAKSTYEMNCSMEAGGSGQPFLSGLITDPQNPNVFLSDGGRPRLIVWGIFNSGGGRNADVPNFRTRGFATLFDEAMRREFEPYLNGPVDALVLGRRSEATGGPQFILSLRPRYTEDARLRKVEGPAELEFRVRADGTVRHVSLVSGVDTGLDALLLAAAQKWVFSPATRNGVPVEGTASVTYHFRLPPD